MSDDLYKARKKLLGALEQAGAEVFPKSPYPLTTVEYEQALGRDLGGCSLFVQLLSDLPGRELHGSTKTIVTAQLELAKSLNKTILQWRDRELDLNEVEEDSQRQILEGASVMAISLEELQYEVLHKAFPKPARESHTLVPTTGDALVFVQSDAIDQALVKEICEVLEREQIGWVIPSETESPERVRHEFEDLLLGCDALMLIYGQSPGGWVRQQLMNCRKLQHKRETPLRALAVFEGPPPTNNPYPGLRPFKREESDIFFGREQHVDQLLEKLGQHHFLAVVGTSGCGKSSLVKAGMLPALDAGFLAQAGAHWYVADLRPGHRPMWALAESLLVSQAFGATRGTEPESLALLHATLRRGPLGLVEALCETPLPERANLLVLVDQFEEIFRYRRDIDSQEADAFVTLLVASARQREVNVY
ncbi:MAG: ATP-binding protein, partial [Beggiatoa sp.]|nr:ATP-binding protein [Beggiatoa sp.]